MTFRVLDSFRADFRCLPVRIQERVDQTLSILDANPRHPSLQVKRLLGTRDICECRVSLGYPITFQWAGEVLTLRRVGTHNILKEESR
jgi:hypothetical protein